MISKGRTGGLLVVSCSQPVDEPPADSRLSRRKENMVRKVNKCIKKWLDNSALRWRAYGEG